MADVFTLTLNTKLAEKAMLRLREQSPWAIARAINRSIASGKTIMVREVAGDLKLKAMDVRDRFGIREATRERHVAQLTASAARIPLIKFNARGPEPSYGRGRGVSAAGKRYPHAFIATMRSGHRGVFTRRGRARIPVAELRGASVAHVATKHVAVGIARCKEQLVKNLQSEFRFATLKGAA